MKVKQLIETVHEKVEVTETKIVEKLPEETTIGNAEEWTDCIEDTVEEAIG